MRVFIANFGRSNWAWPECKASGTLAVMDDLRLHPYWVAGDREGYVQAAQTNLHLTSGKRVSKAVASRWFNLNNIVAETSGDLWIHREKDEIWWAQSLPDAGSEEIVVDPYPREGSLETWLFRKPCTAWSDRDLKGRELRWKTLHPRAREFLFTEGTLQQLSADHAAYARALTTGEPLAAWHNRTEWSAKVGGSKHTTSTKMRTFVALEKAIEIHKAVRTWGRKFSEGALALPGMGGTVYWHESLGVWGFFDNPKGARRKPESYWNPFGRIPDRFRQNMTVEINPPGSGINKRMRGAIAVDGGGNCWVLHQGALVASGRNITPHMFRDATKLETAEVSFSDGSTAEYYLVASLNDSAASLQKQIASYVIECDRIRQRYKSETSDTASEAVAGVQDVTIDAAEVALFPELQGSYVVGPQDAKEAVRFHADVWVALIKVLEDLEAGPSNARVGRYGPDLRTTKGCFVLFEIKSESTASDFHEGVGQLFVYEKLLGGAYKKVLVMPRAPGGAFAVAIKALGIDCLVYSRSGRRVRFDQDAISALLLR